MRFYHLAIFVIFLSISLADVSAQILPGGITNEDIIKKKKYVDGDPRMISALALKYVKRPDDYSIEGGLDFLIRFYKPLYIAASIYTQLNNSNQIRRDGLKLNIRTYYAGLGMSYYKEIHKGFSISSGIIASLASLDTSPTTAQAYRTEGWHWHLLLEPTFTFSFPIYKGTHLGIGVGYRQALGIDFLDLKNSDLSCYLLKLSVINYSY